MWELPWPALYKAPVAQAERQKVSPWKDVPHAAAGGLFCVSRETTSLEVAVLSASLAWPALNESQEELGEMVNMLAGGTGSGLMIFSGVRRVANKVRYILTGMSNLMIFMKKVLFLEAQATLDSHSNQLYSGRGFHSIIYLGESVRSVFCAHHPIV